MMSYYSGKFLLKWNEFWQNIGSPYYGLRYNPDFYDVTLVDEDQQIKAHTLIFAANTTFLRTVFKRNTYNHPINYKGAKGQRIVGLSGFHQPWRIAFYSEDLEVFIALAENC